MSKKGKKNRLINEIIDLITSLIYSLLAVGNLFLFGFLFAVSLEVEGELIIFFLVITAVSTILFGHIAMKITEGGKRR